MIMILEKASGYIVFGTAIRLWSGLSRKFYSLSDRARHFSVLQNAVFVASEVHSVFWSMNTSGPLSGTKTAGP